jgi:WD40 repeat protein/beta-lactamase regulating signal transducer with metallopeptidase domain
MAGPWAGVALVQVTLVAVLGLLAWLAARRGGPAVRGAVLLAALAGLLAVPMLAVVAPVWLPLPDCLCLGSADPAPTGTGDGGPTLPPLPAREAGVVAVTVGEPPAKLPPGTEDMEEQPGEGDPLAENTEPIVFTVSVPARDAASPARPSEPARRPWSLAGVLTAIWLCGTFACLARALGRLALLYRCLWRARLVCDEEWTACLKSLAERYGLPAVALRESAAVASPLTMGLFRPVIVLPRGRRAWSAEQRALILGHELAHVQRRDFLAGLVAELAACLCWFHPLVRWLAGRLRLEQEYAADAWVASAASDSTNYVRCLARLALELSRGRGSLAPAFWRRRPEILRRIDMLRRNPHGQPPRLGRGTAWTVAVLAAAACVAVAGVGPLRSAVDGPKPAEAGPAIKDKTATDLHGDPLPAGALARLGTTRWRHGANVTFVTFGSDGTTLLTASQDNTIRLWDLATGTEIRRFARPKLADSKPSDKSPANQKAQLEAAKVQLQVVARGGRIGTGSPSVALAPDGKTLAAFIGNVVQLWEVETGKDLRQIQGPPNGLAGLLFSPDGKTLAARGADGSLYLWEADTGKEIRQIKAPQRQGRNQVVLPRVAGGDVSGMAFTPDGKALAVSATEFNQQTITSSVKFWDVATGQETRQIKAPQGVRVSAVSFTPDGKILAYGSNNMIQLCEADTGNEVRQITVRDGVLTLIFSPDGKTLATRGRNQQVRLWETETGKELYQLGDTAPAGRATAAVVPANNFGAPEVRNLAFSPDGKRIATTQSNTVRLWETATGKELPLSDGHQGPISAVTLSPDGKTVLSWGTDRMIRRWEAATGKLLGQWRPPGGGTTFAALSPDGRTVALAGTDNSIRLYDAAANELNKLTGHPNGIAALAFTPDGKILAARGGDNSIQLYDVAKGSELRQIMARPVNNSATGGAVLIRARTFVGSGAGLAFSPDSKLVAAPSPASSGPGGIRVATLPRPAGPARGTISLYDTATGKEIRGIEIAQTVVSFTFSPDGRILATENGDQTITLWEVASGKERARLGKPATPQPPNAGGPAFAVAVNGFVGFPADPAGPITLAFSPDGRTLAARGPDRSVHIWDVDAGKELGQFKGHEGRIETVAFAADGKTIASGSADTTILVWDAAGLMKDLPKPQTIELEAAEVEPLWNDLAGEGAAKAFQSMLKLASAPKQAIPFLGERLKPAAAIDPQKMDRWIADLDSEKYAVRQEASTNLVKVGEQAVPVLQKVLTSQPALETRKRVEELLDKLTGGTLTTEQLRLVRAVEALERMGTPEAQQQLQTLAKGATGALPTRESQAALDRLGRP